MKYKEYKGIDYAEIATEVLSKWKKEDIFAKSVESREGAPSFTFYEGPPSANGTPGIHHVMARAVKDIFCRYKTLKGFQVKRKGGWDTHGLPVELQVEKELGITKEDIGNKISVEEYNLKCKEAVMKYKDQWDDLTEKMGYWVDLNDPYITFNRDYMESLWYLLKKLYDKELLYEDLLFNHIHRLPVPDLVHMSLTNRGVTVMLRILLLSLSLKLLIRKMSSSSPGQPLPGHWQQTPPWPLAVILTMSR